MGQLIVINIGVNPSAQANSLAQRGMPECRGVSMSTLLANWVRLHEIAESDKPYIQNRILIKFEDLAANPHQLLADILEFAGLESAAPSEAGGKKVDINAKPRDAYCDELRRSESAANEHRTMQTELEPRVIALGIPGYDLSESWPCLADALAHAHTQTDEL